MRPVTLFLLLPLLTACGWQNDDLIRPRHVPDNSRSALDFTLPSITGEAIPLSRYRGNVILIVNTASKCGLTPQYRDLEALYQQYKDKGFVILGFPANDFMKQEPGDNRQILEFCERNYGVSFPMFGKISVKGGTIHPLYRYLTKKGENGLFNAPVKWNFQKFLLDRRGRLVAAIGPKRRVTDPEVRRLLEQQLAAGRQAAGSL